MFILPSQIGLILSSWLVGSSRPDHAGWLNWGVGWSSSGPGWGDRLGYGDSVSSIVWAKGDQSKSPGLVGPNVQGGLDDHVDIAIIQASWFVQVTQAGWIRCCHGCPSWLNQGYPDRHFLLPFFSLLLDLYSSKKKNTLK